MVKVFLEAGTIFQIDFISPLERDRQVVRQIIGSENMLEIHCDCPLEISASSGMSKACTRKSGLA